MTVELAIPDVAGLTKAEAAVAYAEAGWRVGALWWTTETGTCACGGTCRPKNIGKHPLAKPGICPDGLRSFSSHVAQVAGWWRRHPQANIAILPPADVFALDVDDPETWQERGVALPKAGPRQRTGSGGGHRQYLYHLNGHARDEITFNTKLPGYGAETKGDDGGYIVVPPSITRNPYEWVGTGPIPVVPDELYAILPRRGAETPHLESDDTDCCAIPDRIERNPGGYDWLRNRAAHLRAGHGIVGEQARLLLTPALTQMVPPYGPGDGEGEIARILAYDDANPERIKRGGRIELGTPPEGEEPPAAPTWPDPPASAAYDGLVGRVVRFAAPYTEADPIAIAGSFLAAFGCALNAGPHARVGAERHPARLNLALVGRSSVARKGSSWAPVRELMFSADPVFITTRIVSGLGSGEALIHAVRDGDDDKDPGVQDKRALVFAPEFASLLRVMTRQGSILSGIVREAWDSGRLENRVKTNPAVATRAHVSIVAHTTDDELARDLTDTDARSGFGNRFIYLAVRRSKLLPSPPVWGGREVDELGRAIREALETARRKTVLVRDAQAEERWRSVYGHLTRERRGLAGILTSRAEAQVLRLSLTYALMDGAEQIELSHLESALALWDYSERSTVYIFGNRTGDPIADRIVEAAFPRISRSDIHDMFGRHVTKDRIESVIHRLVREGLVTRTYQQTRGRRIEFIEAVRDAR